MSTNTKLPGKGFSPFSGNLTRFSGTSNRTPPDQPSRRPLTQVPVSPTRTQESGAAEAPSFTPCRTARRMMRYTGPRTTATGTKNAPILLDPDNMDDLDRILWRSKLHPYDHLGFYDDDDARGDDIPSLQPKDPGIYCRDYWAEPLGPGNADLRNHGFETQCRSRLDERITGRYSQLADAANYEEDNDLAYETANQYVRILQWLDMSGDGASGIRETPLHHPPGAEPVPLRPHWRSGSRRELHCRLP